MTAPATVSGERSQRATGENREGWLSMDPRVRRPAIMFHFNPGGASRKEAIMVALAQASLISGFSLPLLQRGGRYEACFLSFL
ncbi:hypothetical protein GCM10007094_44080 [Pseudovibrio japonicus]|uniref:Uncharacterized protein n=1 Tax=Pseudovibrio japonicus TaxID=366534 RepID=A0ABQ3ERY7_9HYPH|nr:hypothetical protein GCM10007094_44080 [Pseudovibrio japonicus]